MKVQISPTSWRNNVYFEVGEMVKIMYMDCLVYCLRNKACLLREGDYEVMHFKGC